jgi:septum formation protein
METHPTDALPSAVRIALVLGSSSRYRAELLGRLGVPFTQESPDVDEESYDGQFPSMSAEDFALTLARAKAAALRRPDSDRWLLCADQVGVLEAGGERILLRKPGTPERCVEQLMLLAGRTHRLVNGVVLLSEQSGTEFTAIDVQELQMRPFGRGEAEAYVAERSPLDSAGGYRIEDEGIRLFERIASSDYTGIIGLPLIATARLFRQAGLL